MNALDIIKYGHKDVLDSVNGLPDTLRDKPGVTTSWSVKDTLGHIASYEHLLEDVLNSVAKPGSETPYLDEMKKSPGTFNDVQVPIFRKMSFDELLDDYNKTYVRVRQLVGLLGPEKLLEVGTIPWYGVEYSLDDFIVYASYGHKREHTGQIKQFIKREKMDISES